MVVFFIFFFIIYILFWVDAAVAKTRILSIFKFILHQMLSFIV